MRRSVQPLFSKALSQKHPMKLPPREIEIKLELTAEQWRRLRDRIRSEAEGEGAAAQPLQTRTLRSIYFDTPTWALRKAGMALRVRQVDDRWIQTLKAARSLDGGISRSFEIEAEVATGKPDLGAIRDKSWRREVTRRVRPGGLVAVFETVIERVTTQRKTPDGATIEIALDRGTICAGARKVQVRELELELKGGDPSALLDIARDIVATGPFQPSRHNKADCGFRLAGESSPETLSASKAQRIEITSSTRPTAAIVQLCAVTTKHILHNWHVLSQADVPAAAHQIRIGLRRLRAVLRLSEATLDAAERDRLASAARDLGRDVGRVRNLHVIADDLVAPLAGHAGLADGISKLKDELALASLARRQELLNKLQDAQYGHFQVELGLLPEIVATRAHARPSRVAKRIESLATRTIAQLVRRVEKRGRHMSKLSVDERHELRKAIKPLRYTIEFFASLYPKSKIQRLLGATIEMQEALGYLNDAALAQTLPEIMSTDAAADPSVQRATGAVIGWHSARAELAWKDFPQIWRNFERAVKAIES